jgi:phage portal protein BeeE
MAPFISRKNYADLRARLDKSEAEVIQLKGYYGGDNTQNEYFKQIEQQLRGLRLPPMNIMSREEIRRAYETIGPVQGIIDFIADNVGEVMKYLELREVHPDGTYKYLEKHWLMDVLRKPNDRFNLKRFGKAWAVNRLLFGDAFVYAPLTAGKDRQIDAKIGMYVLPGQRIAIKEGGLIAPMKGITLLGTSNKEIEIEGKVFESFDYNLDDTSFFGTSKVVAAALYLNIMDKGMRRQDISLDNGGAAGIITPKADTQYGIKPSDADAVEKDINSSSNFNRIKTLRTAIEYHALGNKPIDLDILASHKEAVTALCFLYRLPVDLYYGQAKYENQKEAKKAIYEQQAIPLAEEFAADLLSYTKLDQQGLELVVNTDEIPVLQEKPGDVLDTLDKMHASLNERRTANGYDRIEEPYADEPMIPMGIQFGNETYDIDENA